MSSTIKQAIEALKNRVADAYTAISAKGGTLPATQDSANLPAAIASIPAGGAKTIISSAFSSITSFYRGLPYEELHEEVLDFGGMTFATYSNQLVFYQCTNVKRIDLSGWNCTLGAYMSQVFAYCNNLEELYMNGNVSVNTSGATMNCSLMFYGCGRLRVFRVGSWFTRVQAFSLAPTALDRDGIVQFFNDIGTAYDNTQVITLGSAKLALLSADDIAIATDKGWTLA